MKENAPEQMAAKLDAHAERGRLEAEVKRASLDLQGALSNMSSKVFTGINLLGVTDAEGRTFDPNMYENMRIALSLYAYGLYAKGNRSLLQKLALYPLEPKGNLALVFNGESNQKISEDTLSRLPALELSSYLTAEMRFQKSQNALLDFSANAQSVPGFGVSIPREDRDRRQEIDNTMRVLEAANASIKSQRMSAITAEDNAVAEQFLDDELS